MLREKLENTNKKFSMRLAGACSRNYINRFSDAFSTKMQRTNTLKVEYAFEMKFLSGKWIWGLKIQVNILTFTAGRQASGFHVLVSIWTTSRACVVAFKSPRPRPVGRRRLIRRRCLRSLMLFQSSLVSMFIPVIPSRFQTYQPFLVIPVITGPP